MSGKSDASLAAQFGPELVVGVAKPVGTPDDKFYQELEGTLLSYGYETKRIKLSAVLADQLAERGVEVDQEHEDARINQLMDEGDNTCRQAQSAAAMASLAVNEIREYRIEYHSEAGPRDITKANEAVPRIAYVVDSLKRPDEVTLLRSIYGDHFLLIGLQASEGTRKTALDNRLRPQRALLPSPEREKRVELLIARDFAESEEYGQNMLKTFPMADVFIDMDVNVGVQVHRVLDLLFGNPDYPRPTEAEYGMHLAYVSSTRSPELGLKVGSAIMSGNQSVISLGVNSHPLDESSPAFDASALDIRDLIIDTLGNLGEGSLSMEMQRRLTDDAESLASELVRGPLKNARINGLTEFQLTVHAEMSALMDALRIGTQVHDARMYVTAYPCHNCAKHILNLGLELIYLEPYPKSRAASMYGKGVADSFKPFTGIAPRRYEALFDVTADRKNPDGSRHMLSSTEKKRAQPRVDALLDHTGIVNREAGAVTRLPTHLEEDLGG